MSNLSSHGPDPLRGGSHCRGDATYPIATLVPDWCCCCDPCTQSGDMGAGIDKCCKCIPQVICFYFTIDGAADDCCRDFGIFVPVDQSLGLIHYLATFPGDPNFTILLSIVSSTGYPGDPCQWRVESAHLGVDEVYPIDHFSTTCLIPPAIEITGVTITMSATAGHSCSGTITFGNWESSKIPFHAADTATVTKLPDLDLVYSPCDCTTIAQKLCVGGVRHAEGPVEYVVFSLTSDLSDPDYIFWSYLPPGGDPVADTEVLWLRSDSYGNCYLVFDSVRTADPDNPSFPVIVDDWGEWIPINGCGCEIHARSSVGTGDSATYITIHSAPTGTCGRWNYICDDCRCVPTDMCVIGMLGGYLINETATWDGEAWVSANFRFVLGAGTGGCTVSVESVAYPPFDESDPLLCNHYTSFTSQAPYDESQPDIFNWVWAGAKHCQCFSFFCGLCILERCDGPPQTLTVLNEFGIRPGPLIDPYSLFDCSWTVIIHYYRRNISDCGYIGYGTYTCFDDTFLVEVSVTAIGGVGIMTVTKWLLPDMVLDVIDEYPDNLGTPTYCDPYYYHREFGGPTGPYEYLTVSEV